MSCSSPNVMVYDNLEGYIFRGPRQQERHVFDLSRADVQDIPCGKCELCKLDRRYSNALRIMLEAESWPGKSYFFTLTFDEEHVGDNVLDHSEWRQFIVNFRQKFCQAKYCDIRKRRDYYGKIRSVTFKKIKQVMCGEYGGQFGRKHFHGIIFNHAFDDLIFTGSFSDKGFPIYSSPGLQAVWKKGIVQISPLVFDLALYVGKYINERELGDGQYGRMGQGIGESWIRKWWRDVLCSGRVKTLTRDFPVPRYFKKKIQEMFPVEFLDYQERQRLRLEQQRVRMIRNGDGPLRRAKAKGRIQFFKQQKRRVDSGKL